MSLRTKAAWPLGCGFVATLMAGCATVPPPARLDSFNLGKTASGEACVATRAWADPAIADPFARAYAITCSTAAASRPLGAIRVVATSPEALATLDKQFGCGAEQAVTLAGRPATLRRCQDRVTGLDSLRLDQVRGDRRYVASGTPALLAQLEEGIAITSGERAPSADVTRTLTATIDPAVVTGIGAAAPASVAGVQGDALNVAGVLAQGISLNHKGLNVEASRILNDALSRLPAETPPATRVELLLEAGLADSNILFPETAAAHFAEADTLLTNVPAARNAFLMRKRDTYHALDALNRRAFREALTEIDRSGQGATPSTAAQPLTDPETLRQLNQPRTAGAAALAVADASNLAARVLDVQRDYTRSVALLALGDEAGATTALDAAALAYRPLSNQRLDQSRLLWLGARIARQRGRLEARAGRYGRALDSYNDAVDQLRRGSIANGGTGAEPAIAEAELERAAVYARTGANRDSVRNTFAEAVDALIASGSTSFGNSIGMEDYLDLLVGEAAQPRADTYDRFFRAVQANGEPAVARQLTQLRAVVAADPKLGAVIRERADLEREITRLRYALADKREDAAASGADLVRARDAAEARLLQIDAQLAADPRYRQVDEAPATLAELRGALRPGEVYVKLTELNRRIYGLVVTADRTMIYHVANSTEAKAAVDQLGDQLRASIDGGLRQGQLVPFDEARGYTLYRLVSGPAAGLIAAAPSIVVDPAGPLARLPLGTLVTRYDAQAPKGTDPFDFSRTAFLARSAAISTALSPRSFLVARALPPSRARRPFLGMGDHRPPPTPAPGVAARPVEVGYGCAVDFGRLASLSRSLKPISPRELGIAAGALGDGRGTMITGAAFSDTAVKARTDLDQYEVLHFATHGLEEGMWGCAKSPPALVTSFGDAGSDGLLSFSEIADFRLDANLVVLSACDTAAGVQDEAVARSAGQEEAGATLDGLVRAFLTANARAVLATYWQVSAEAESDAFIRAFYERGRTGTMGEALQAAQRTLMTQSAYSHPFYWAPYFLVGDSSKTMLSPPPAQVAQR